LIEKKMRWIKFNKTNGEILEIISGEKPKIVEKNLACLLIPKDIKINNSMSIDQVKKEIKEMKLRPSNVKKTNSNLVLDPILWEEF